MTTPSRKPWSVEDVREILAGTMEPAQIQERIRTADRKGLSPVTFAAMKAATAADSLLPLLTLLEPPGEAEKSKMDLVLNLLERIAEGQIVLTQRMDTLESAISEWRGTSLTDLPMATVRPVSGH